MQRTHLPRLKNTYQLKDQVSIQAQLMNLPATIQIKTLKRMMEVLKAANKWISKRRALEERISRRNLQSDRNLFRKFEQLIVEFVY